VAKGSLAPTGQSKKDTETEKAKREKNLIEGGLDWVWRATRGSAEIYTKGKWSNSFSVVIGGERAGNIF
jgi:ferric iron reductase protein FhuF